MFDDYVALDVETASSLTPSICSIGLVEVIGGIVEERFYSLVNPGTSFDYHNILVHGITPEMVADAPGFLELWPEIRRFFTGKVVIAHNAPFDLSQLAYSLRGLEDAPSSFYYLDTVTLARRAFPGLESYSLGRLSYTLGLPSFHHHNALADAEAAQVLFERSRPQLSLDTSSLRRYGLPSSGSPLAPRDFLWAIEVRQVLHGLSPKTFLQPAERIALRALAESTPSFHPGVQDLLCLMQEILEDEYVFASLEPRLTLLWSLFFPAPDWVGAPESLRMLHQLLRARQDELAPALWLGYHEGLKDDPLLSPLFHQLRRDPYSGDALSHVEFLLSPFDPWEPLQGKRVAACGKFLGTSAKDFLRKHPDSTLCSSFKTAEILIVGAKSIRYDRTLREAMLRRLEQGAPRIVLQPL